MRYVLLALLALLGLGADADCDGREDPPRGLRQLLPRVPDGVWLDAPAYYKDIRTGLCFAAYGLTWADSVVLVPCGVVEGAAVKAKLDEAKGIR